MLFRVFAWYATERPPTDQHCSFILVDAENETQAELIAAQIVASHSEMPTRTEVVRGP